MKSFEINTEIKKRNIFNSADFQHKIFSSLPFQGSFLLDRTLKTLLSKLADNTDLSFPVFIILSSDLVNAIYSGSLEYFQQYYPESDYFFIYKSNKLMSCNFKNKKLHINHKREIKKFQWNLVVSWPDKVTPEKFLRLNNEPSIIVKQNFKHNNINGNEKGLKDKTALELSGMWQYHILHPEKTEQSWRRLIKVGLSARVMTPATSFIVVENEAQRRRLKKAQKEILKGKKFFSYKKDEKKMSEPGLFVLLIIFLLIILWRKYKRKKWRLDSHYIPLS